MVLRLENIFVQMEILDRYGGFSGNSDSAAIFLQFHRGQEGTFHHRCSVGMDPPPQCIGGSVFPDLVLLFNFDHTYLSRPHDATCNVMGL